jgi:hypothetical protein
MYLNLSREELKKWVLATIGWRCRQFLVTGVLRRIGSRLGRGGARAWSRRREGVSTRTGPAGTRMDWIGLLIDFLYLRLPPCLLTNERVLLYFANVCNPLPGRCHLLLRLHNLILHSGAPSQFTAAQPRGWAREEIIFRQWAYNYSLTIWS